MDLLNEKVVHKRFGNGTITACDGDFITVEFAGRTSRFSVSSAYERFFTMADSEIEAEVVAEVKAAKEKKAAEEAERRREEEKQWIVGEKLWSVEKQRCCANNKRYKAVQKLKYGSGFYYWHLNEVLKLNLSDAELAEITLCQKSKDWIDFVDLRIADEQAFFNLMLEQLRKDRKQDLKGFTEYVLHCAKGLFEAQIKDAMEEIAETSLYQKSRNWLDFVRLGINDKGAFFSCLLELFRVKVKSSASCFSEYMRLCANAMTVGQAKTAITLLTVRGYRNVDRLMSEPGIEAALSGTVIEENPIEQFVREYTSAAKPDEMFRIIADGGIPYAGSRFKCSVEAVMIILTEYRDEWKRCCGTRNNVPDGALLRKQENADRIAAALDSKELLKLLESKARVENLYGPYLLAWARFADEESILRVTSRYKTMLGGRAKAGYKAKRIREALMINETTGAMKFFYRIGELERYAKMHGLTSAQILNSMIIPDFGLDDDGVKRYDIGGNIIEVRVTPKMTFALYDTNRQKEVRSFPKKSDDPEKAAGSAKQFADFKKLVLSFARERVGLLRRMQLERESIEQELWRNAYFEHPVARCAAGSLVWMDETGRTFICHNGQMFDSDASPYAPEGSIRVAHVLDMHAADILRWQKWLADNKVTQIFEQIWEPVYRFDSQSITKRYFDAVITKEERNQLKSALSKRGIKVTMEYSDSWYNHYDNVYEYSDDGYIRFGDALSIRFERNPVTEEFTLGAASSWNRYELNVVIREIDKVTISSQIARDNAEALTDSLLAGYNIAQITEFLDIAAQNKAAHCSAILLEYKNAHFPECFDFSEFSLDW